MKTRRLGKRLLIPLLLIEIAVVGVGLGFPAQSDPIPYCQPGQLPPKCTLCPPPDPSSPSEPCPPPMVSTSQSSNGGPLRKFLSAIGTLL